MCRDGCNFFTYDILCMLDISQTECRNEITTTDFIFSVPGVVFIPDRN